MTASVLLREVKTCRFLNISATNADIRWSFSKKRGLLENIPAISATAPMCKSCFQVLPLGAANQQLKPVNRAQAAHVRPISVRAVPALIVCDAKGPLLTVRFVRALHFISFR
jgi:hypothetical protein